MRVTGQLTDGSRGSRNVTHCQLWTGVTGGMNAPGDTIQGEHPNEITKKIVWLTNEVGRWEV